MMPVTLDYGFLDNVADDVKLMYVEIVLKDASAFKKVKDYRYCKALIEPERVKIRASVARGELDGLEYLAQSHRLDMIEGRIRLLQKASNFRFRRGKDSHEYANMGDRTQWNVVSQDQARICTTSGKMTRTTGEGTHKRWEVAE